MQLFPTPNDDLLDGAALPKSASETELNYRTRPLSAENELRLTFILLFGPVFVLIALASLLNLFLWTHPFFDRLTVSIVILLALRLGFRKLIGVSLRHTVAALLLLLSAYVCAKSWSTLNGPTWCLLGVLVSGIVSCLISRQVAAWILVNPRVDILVPVIEGVADASNVASTAKPKATEQLDSAITRFNDQAAREELARKIADEEKRKLEAEEKERAKAESDRKEAEARAILVKEARTEEVQRVLQPFLTPRRLQPRLAGASVQMRTTLDEAPMSFSALQNMGALENTLDGLTRLVRIGTHRDLSRPKWDYGTSSRAWSSETLNQLKHAQELLRRLGPTLVSESLLSQ